MATYTKGRVLSDVVKREFDPFYNRDSVKMTSGNFVPGSVVSKTADGKYTAVAGGEAPTEAVGVVLFECDASTIDKSGVILARGPAVVAVDMLVFPEGLTDPEKNTAISQLEERGIVGRISV